MILYFSGISIGDIKLSHKIEKRFRKISIMMSFGLIKGKKLNRRFRKIYKQRKQK